MPELCQMWERREGGTPFPLLPKPSGDSLARPAARAGVAGMPPLAPVERDNLAATPDPPCGFGGGGWVPLATPPLSPPSNPALFPARREEEEQGQGPAGRQAGRRAPGRAGAACHVGGAALPGCLCVPVPLQRPGQGVSREEEAGQLCRGEVAGFPPLFLLPLPATPGMGSEPSSSYRCLQLQEGLARGVPAGGAGTPQFPASSQVQGSMTLLPASLSFSPHPCLAPRIPVQPGHASPVTTCWDVQDGWEGCPLSVPPLSYLPLIRAVLCFPVHGHIPTAPIVLLSLHSWDLCSV